MVLILTGDDSFEIQRVLKDAEAAFSGTAEHIDGATLELAQLPDILMGQSLFSEKRLVVIRGLSENKTLWERVPEWLPRVSDDIELILVEQKPDKRTTTYKTLKSQAEVREFEAWTERDRVQAETWVAHFAAEQGVTLSREAARKVVQRVGLDKWQLASAVDKLSLLDAITVEAVESTIDTNPSENVFELLEAALDGERRRVSDMIRTFELQEDPYALFALLSSQVFQLAAVTFASKDDQPSKDFAIHPFVASKLKRHASRLGRGGVEKVLKTFAQTDADLKISKAEPWLLIEKTLLSL